MRTVITFAAAGAMMIAASMPAAGQKKSVADVARRMSGTWRLNRELSPAFGASGRAGRGRTRGGAPHGSLFQRGGLPQGVRANPTNTEPTPSGASDLTPAELAERSAIRQMQQIPPTMVIAAAADHVSIEDERGEQSCATDGRAGKVRAFRVYMDVKCKWDKDRLRQEYAITRSKLIRVWRVGDDDRLVLTAKIEGINQNTPEAVAIFDRSGS